MRDVSSNLRDVLFKGAGVVRLADPLWDGLAIRFVGRQIRVGSLIELEVSPAVTAAIPVFAFDPVEEDR